MSHYTQGLLCFEKPGNVHRASRSQTDYFKITDKLNALRILRHFVDAANLISVGLIKQTRSYSL